MKRETFSITTMASSTTRPVASVMPNRVSVLNREVEELDERERADERHRDGDGGDDGDAQALEEDEDDEDDERDGLGQRDEHLVDRLADGQRGVERDGVAEPRGEAPGEAGELLLHALGDVERVGPRELRDAEPARRLAVEAEEVAVPLGPQLGAADVAQVHEIAPGPARTTMSSNSRGSTSLPLARTLSW